MSLDLANSFPKYRSAVRSPLDPQARRLLHLAQNLKDLASRDESIRATAAERLTELSPTTDELIGLLSDRDNLVRKGAAEQLRDVPESDATAAIDRLLAALDDRSDLVVESAVGSLGILRAAAAREQLIDMLADRNPRIVHAVIFALGRIGPAEEVGQHLIPFIASPSDHLCYVALAALRQVGHVGAAPVILEHLETYAGKDLGSDSSFTRPTKYIQTLVALNAQEAVPVLTRLAQETIGLRCKAVDALARLKATAAAAELTEFLGRLLQGPTEPQLCSSLLRFLREVNGREALPLIRRCLRYSDREVRQTALSIVTDWRDEEAVSNVREICYFDRSALLRPVAVASLVTLADRGAIADLMALATDANASVRRAALSGLRAMADLPAEAEVVLARGDDPTRAARPDEPLVPLELQGQVEAARGFLCRWKHALEGRGEIATGAKGEELMESLGRLIHVLGE